MNVKDYILVVGSSNTDMVIKTAHLPGPGETVIGGSFFMNAGGKGANQAVAAARLGSRVVFICKIGNDIFGQQSVELFNREGIDTTCLLSDPLLRSGVALITVDDHAENCIAVASGANAALSPEDLKKNSALIRNAAVILMQLEIPLETVRYVADIGHQAGVPVILNPAPACVLPDELLRSVAVLTPNRKEAEMISGIRVHDNNSAEAAAKAIRDRGVQKVIITLGAEGALVYEGGEIQFVPGVPVTAVDTTAAGDVFNGALAAAMFEGARLLDATAYACRAAAISVTRMGAQNSAPYKKEVDFPVHNHSI